MNSDDQTNGTKTGASGNTETHGDNASGRSKKEGKKSGKNRPMEGRSERGRRNSTNGVSSDVKKVNYLQHAWQNCTKSCHATTIETLMR